MTLTLIYPPHSIRLRKSTNLSTSVCCCQRSDYLCSEVHMANSSADLLVIFVLTGVCQTRRRVRKLQQRRCYRLTNSHWYVNSASKAASTWYRHFYIQRQVRNTCFRTTYETRLILWLTQSASRSSDWFASNFLLCGWLVLKAEFSAEVWLEYSIP